MEVLLIGSVTKHPTVNLIPESISDFVILEKFRKEYSKLMGEVCWSEESHSIGSQLKLSDGGLAHISIKLPLAKLKKQALKEKNG